MSRRRIALPPASPSHRPIARRLGRLRHQAVVVATLAALVVTGCGSTVESGIKTRADLNQVLTERGVDPSKIVLPFALSPEMKEFAKITAPRRYSEVDRLKRLRERLLDPSQMALEYSWGYTGTAIEVFEQRQANCLAFTFLFLAMAREVGVPVYFMAVDNVESYRRRGDLVVVSDHIAVGYGETTGRKIFDFSEEPEEDPRFVRKISDLTAIAMFHSNRGAEALQDGRVMEGVSWLRAAVAVDPSLANSWVNLGVALRRQGLDEEAEYAYKRALASDAAVNSAYHNLASLLRTQGRDDEAREYETTLQDVSTQNPYTYLALGDISFRQGDLDEAERFYRRAVHLASDDPEVFAALGQLALATGDERLARRMLRRAQKTGQESPRVEVLATRLEGQI